MNLLLLLLLPICAPQFCDAAPTANPTKDYYDYYAADNGAGIAIDFVTIAPEPETSTHKHRHSHHHNNTQHKTNHLKTVQPVAKHSDEGDWSYVVPTSVIHHSVDPTAPVPSNTQPTNVVLDLLTKNPLTELAKGVAKLLRVRGRLGFDLHANDDNELQLDFDRAVSIAGIGGNDRDRVVLSPTGPRLDNWKTISAGGIELGRFHVKHATHRNGKGDEVEVVNCREGHVIGGKFSNCDTTLIDSAGWNDALDFAQAILNP